MRSFIALTMRRRVTVGMMAVAATLLGLAAYLLMPVELFPEGFASQAATVRIPVLNGNPSEVQESVVRPTEQELRSIPGVREISTRARADGARLEVSFSAEVDANLMVAEIRDRLERARVAWPDEVRDYRIFRFDMDTDLPIYSFALDMKERREELTFLVEEKVIKPLEALPGVARVTCWGLLDDQVRVHLDPDLADAQGISLWELRQLLSRSNLELTGGEIVNEDVRYAVRLDARIRTIEQLENFPINDDGLLLGQVARIEPAQAVREFIALSRGQPTLWCQVYKESSANTVAVADRVRAFVEGPLSADRRLQESGLRPRPYEMLDFGRTITSALSTLEKTAMGGALLALLVLWFFLRRVRMTLIVTMAIPLSLLLTISALYFLGESLNLLSMLGITVAIGMLIDNAIVVVENTARHRDLGHAPREAGVRGATEVGLAITLSTLTTLAAFLPVIFMSGSQQQIAWLTRGIGLPLCLAISASLLVALLFVPLLTATFDRRHRGVSRESRLLIGIRERYARLLGGVLSNRLLAAATMVGVTVMATALALRTIDWTQLGNDQGGRIDVQVELEGNFTLAESHDVFRRYGEHLDANAERYGLEHYWCFFRDTGGEVMVELKERDARKTKEIARLLRDELPEIPGASLTVGAEEGRNGSEKTHLDIYGPDPRTLSELARHYEERLELVPGVLAVVSDVDDATSEIQVLPDRRDTQRLGVDPRVLRGAVQIGIGGSRFGDMVQGEREIPLIMDYEGADDLTLAELRELSIPNLAGTRIPLSAMARVQRGRGPSEIRRSDGKGRVRLTIEASEEDSRLNERLRAAVLETPLPEGYSFVDQSQQEGSEQRRTLQFALLMGVLFGFFIMGVLFESVLVPFGVLAAIPFAMCGGLWAVALADVTLGLVGGIGVLVLMGVVVNNGIVLLDRVQRLRREGMARRSAILEAGRNRFRPIAMTALTTVIGLVPMALAPAGNSTISYRALAWVLIGGLLAGTLFTLLFVPLAYTVLDDLGQFCKRAWRPRPAVGRRS